MSYIYELIVYQKSNVDGLGNVGTKIKRFVGNDRNQLSERFEMWFIKQGLERESIDVYIGEIQHIGY